MNQLIISIIIFVITVILFFSGKFLHWGLIGLCAAVALQLTGVLSRRNRGTTLPTKVWLCLFLCLSCLPAS